MEKIAFEFEETQEKIEFFVIEQIRMAGVDYLLVSESQEDDAECLILKDTSDAEDADAIYEVVEDDVELSAVLKVFEETLEDIEIEM